MTPTLFQRLLGASFYALPPAVRALHDVRGRACYSGRATVARGRNPLARLCGRVVGLPPAGSDLATTVAFDAASEAETWQRDFGGFAMPSRLRLRDRQIEERLGIVQFRFALNVYEEAIHWRAVRVRLLGVLPLPAAWFRDVYCREGEHDGRYTFLVEAALPLVGRLVRYEGWLAPT